jgi:hypothetical protein
MGQVVFIGKFQGLRRAVGHTQAAKTAMRKIDEIETGSFFAVSMSLFTLNLDDVCRAESHASTAGNAVMSAGFRETLEFDMPAVGGAHM